MTTSDALHASLALLFAELVDGPASDAAFMLNSGDPGLLRSLEGLSAAAASATVAPDGASIAAHLDHVRYGLTLMNRWHDGEANPWADADWAASWRRPAVSPEQWATLRDQLRDEVRRWHSALGTPRDLSATELNGVIASVAHLAYHLGAIRQIDRAIGGPKAE